MRGFGGGHPSVLRCRLAPSSNNLLNLTHPHASRTGYKLTPHSCIGNSRLAPVFVMEIHQAVLFGGRPADGAVLFWLCRSARESRNGGIYALRLDGPGPGGWVDSAS
jgi:hypothetical protein